MFAHVVSRPRFLRPLAQHLRRGRFSSAAVPSSSSVSAKEKSVLDENKVENRSQATKQPTPEHTPSQAELDAQLQARMEEMAGDGGAFGAELENGKPVAMKRSVRDNMFRYI